MHQKESEEGFIVAYEEANSSQKSEFLNQNAEFRTYRVSITYDTYYHSPRLWLSGNDEDENPLTQK